MAAIFFASACCIVVASRGGARDLGSRRVPLGSTTIYAEDQTYPARESGSSPLPQNRLLKDTLASLLERVDPRVLVRCCGGGGSVECGCEILGRGS